MSSLAPPIEIEEGNHYGKIEINLRMKQAYTKNGVTTNLNLEAIKRPEFALLRFIFSKFLEKKGGTGAYNGFIDKWTPYTTQTFMEFYNCFTTNGSLAEIESIIKSTRSLQDLLDYSFNRNEQNDIDTVTSHLLRDISRFANYGMSYDVSNPFDETDEDFEDDEDEQAKDDMEEGQPTHDDIHAIIWDRIGDLLPVACQTGDYTEILGKLSEIYGGSLITNIRVNITDFIDNYCQANPIIHQDTETGSLNEANKNLTLWKFSEDLKNFLNRGPSQRKKDSLFNQAQKNAYGECCLSLIDLYKGNGMELNFDGRRLLTDVNFQRRIRCATVLSSTEMSSVEMLVRMRNDRIHDFIKSRLEKWFGVDKFNAFMDYELQKIIGSTNINAVKEKFPGTNIEDDMIEAMFLEMEAKTVIYPSTYTTVGYPLTDEILPPPAAAAASAAASEKVRYLDNAFSYAGRASLNLEHYAIRIDTIANRIDAGGTASGATESLLAFPNVLYVFNDGKGLYITYQPTVQHYHDGTRMIYLTIVQAYVNINTFEILGSSSKTLNFMYFDGANWDFTGDEINLADAAVVALQVMSNPSHKPYENILDVAVEKWSGDFGYILASLGINATGFLPDDTHTDFPSFLFEGLSNSAGGVDVLEFPEDIARAPSYLKEPLPIFGCDRPALCSEYDIACKFIPTSIPNSWGEHKVKLWIGCLGDPGFQMILHKGPEGNVKRVEQYLCQSHSVGVKVGGSGSYMATSKCIRCSGSGEDESASNNMCRNCNGTGNMNGGGPTSTYYYELLPFIYVDPEILDYLNYNIVISKEAIGYLQYMYSLQYILYDVFFLLSSNKDITSVIFPVYNKSMGIDEADVTKKLKYDTQEEILMKIHISNLIKSLLTRISPTTLTTTISELLNSNVNPEDTKEPHFFEIDTFEKNGNNERNQLESSVSPYIDNINIDEYLIKMLKNINKYNSQMLAPFLSLTLKQAFDSAYDKLGFNVPVFASVNPLKIQQPFQIYPQMTSDFNTNRAILVNGGKRTKRLRNNNKKHKKTKKPKNNKNNKNNNVTKNINKIKRKKPKKTRKQRK